MGEVSNKAKSFTGTFGNHGMLKRLDRMVEHGELTENDIKKTKNIISRVAKLFDAAERYIDPYGRNYFAQIIKDVAYMKIYEFFDTGNFDDTKTLSSVHNYCSMRYRVFLGSKID